MYETLSVWETEPAFAQGSPVTRDFAEIWQGAEKVVYSRTLQTVPTRRTRIEREFDPSAVRQMKEAGDLSIGGPELAAQALKAGLVDGIHLLLAPVIVGGGKPALPSGLTLELELVSERRFTSGFVHLHYRPR